MSLNQTTQRDLSLSLAPQWSLYKEEAAEKEKVEEEEEEVEKEEEEAKSLQFELSSSWHSCRKTSKARLTFDVFVILWKCSGAT